MNDKCPICEQDTRPLVSCAPCGNEVCEDCAERSADGEWLCPLCAEAFLELPF